MEEKFNSYITNIDTNFWKDLCIKKGFLMNFSKGEAFIKVGTVGQYIGYIQSGTLKYVAYSPTGDPHVIGLEFSEEFVADFPFSLYGLPSRVSIIAETDCEIYCLDTLHVREMMDLDPQIKDIIMKSTEAVFSTVYDRYISLYVLSPQARYEELIRRHPALFTLFSLKDIASFLNITPTHLSRLRKNIWKN